MINIAFYGINECIYYDIRNSIDPIVVNIVALIDNSPERQKDKYFNLSVSSLEETDIEAVDYFFITPFTAYESIKAQLIKRGIPENKIQLFITEAICNYNLGSLKDKHINYKIIDKLYLDPAKIRKYIRKYSELYKEYCSVGILNSNKNRWCDKSDFISHAGGGVVNGMPIQYTNSKEAFQYSIKNGFKLIEFDIMYLKKYGIVFAHELCKLFETKEYQFQIMDLDSLLKAMVMHKDISVLFDVKWNNIIDYRKVLNLVSQSIKEKCRQDDYEDIKKRIIFEVYNISTIEAAKKEGYDMFFTTYRYPQSNCLMQIVNICCKYDIVCVGYDVNSFCNIIKRSSIIFSKNIKVFCFSTDEKDIYYNLRNSGNVGIFTNTLRPQELIE